MAEENEIRNAAGMTGTEATRAITHLRSTIVSEEQQQWIKEGRVFQGYEGVLTDEKTFLPADIVRQTPQFMIRVPAGVVIIPIMSLMVFEATTAILQILVSCCNNDPGVGGNMTKITPVNVNTRYSGNSQVSAYGDNSGNTGTAPTGVADLYREYHQADQDALDTNSPTPPYHYNPTGGKGQECAIGDNSNVNAYLFYALAGTASQSTGFSIHTWAEFSYDEYYGS